MVLYIINEALLNFQKYLWTILKSFFIATGKNNIFWKILDQINFPSKFKILLLLATNAY